MRRCALEKLSASKISMWCGILGGLPAIAWYFSAGQNIFKTLRASPDSVWPNIFLGTAVLCFVVMFLANAFAHSRFERLFNRPSVADTATVAVENPSFK